MMRVVRAVVVLSCLAPCAFAADAALDAWLDRELPALVASYKALHAAPELSHHEEKTSALVAKELRGLGFEVMERVGKYPKPNLAGYGVVAVMKNGGGPTVLVRADMDALPVEEKTGLPYASTVRTKNDAGQDVPVMHACGHDIHVTALLGAAKALAARKDRWKGTLLLVGQPAEEMIDGARALLADGLYTRFPKPAFAIALHDNAEYEAGKIVVVPGYALASSTGVEVVVRGVGGHGSRPEATKDPIVLAAQLVLSLQTIVSRENRPFDPAVVSVGAIHGGLKNNIIPDEVRLLLTIRTYKEEVRQHILASIERMARGLAEAAAVPEDRMPTVTVMETTTALYNDPELTRRLKAVFEAAFGKDGVAEGEAVMGSEDFGLFGLEDRSVPVLQFSVGATDPARVKESKATGKPLPSLHSSLFAPQPEPTIRAGVKALTVAVMDLMKP
jgi:amidohydrolase